MTDSPITLLPAFGGYTVFALALAVAWVGFIAIRRLNDGRNAAVRRRALEDGREPASLHPWIDPARCVGCGACTNACPEGKIIGLIGGKAQLLDPAPCVGHGACKAACPVDAIELVFGSARRGVDIPVVSPNFESTVPGLFIAGELGGMGLIANAIEQGRQAIDAIRRLDGLGGTHAYDVIIVGAGPAGLAATLASKQHGLRYLTLEQGKLGGTVAHYPRAKLVMTRPALLPLIGRVKFRRVRKERLIGFWYDVVRRTGVRISDGVRVERVTPRDGGFEVETTAGRFRARAVLLANGRRGSPRRLGVPGEHLPKVVYSLEDPAQYDGQHVLVVGGGDSALEAAAQLVRHRPASVTLSYRGGAFARCKPVNRVRVEEAQLQGRLSVLFHSHVRVIEQHRVIIDQPGRRLGSRNDAVIVCAGGEVPTAFLGDIGVRVETKYGTA